MSTCSNAVSNWGKVRAMGAGNYKIIALERDKTTEPLVVVRSKSKRSG